MGLPNYLPNTMFDSDTFFFCDTTGGLLVGNCEGDFYCDTTEGLVGKGDTFFFCDTPAQGCGDAPQYEQEPAWFMLKV